MFQELSYGPWPEMVSGTDGGSRRLKLVDRVKRSKTLSPASIRRSDHTASFISSFRETYGGGDIEIVDDESLSTVTAVEFSRSYWERESFSKLNLASKEVEQRLEDAAIEKLLAKEALTRDLNVTLRRYALTGRGLTPETADVVRQARRIVKRVLGEFSWDECVCFSRWGPGASTEFGRIQASPQNKWDAVTHSTAACQPLVEAFSSYAKWGFHTPIIVDGNRVTTVPKKTTARRTIAIEPTWNMFFQLGIEGAIRRRLQKVGLLVDRPGYSAQDRHKMLARAGSQVPGLFPTLDFADASNSISRGLVGLLVPDRWLKAMVLVRSDSSVLPGDRKVSMEMFSTMGNGYTFVLMTLLIYAISSAIVGSSTSVFGDDLILPDASKVDSVVRIFSELGFELNTLKSFSKAPFRESCGGHYFRGRDVTPPYFKKQLSSIPAYISYANALYRAGHAGFPLWTELLREVPRRFRGPKGYGDSVAIAPWDMVTPYFDRDCQSWYGETIVGFLPTRDPSERGRLRHSLYPVNGGYGLEVYRKVGEEVRYRTGAWSSCKW